MDKTLIHHARENDLKGLKTDLYGCTDEYLNYAYRDEGTVLTIAIRNNNKEMVRYLIKKKINLSFIDYYKRTYLMNAFRVKNIHIIMILIKSSPILNIRDKFSCDVFDYCYYDYYRTESDRIKSLSFQISTLLKYGAMLYLQTEYDDSVLTVGINYFYDNNIEYVIQALI